MENLYNILDTLNIPKPAQKIYTSLLKDDQVTAKTLANKTGIARTSIYDHIKISRAKDLIVERAIDGTTFFTSSDVRQLHNRLSDKQ